MDTGSSGSSSSDAKLNAPCILILYEGAKQRELGGINGGGGERKRERQQRNWHYE